MALNSITGRSAFLALLKDEGITHLFGNPGTTELPIMHALKDHPDLTYVMGMQESLVVYMADGFSRASGRLSACNVHVAPGLGNAMGALYGAKFTGTPIILTAGQQEQGHGLTEPLLYDPLVPIAQPLVKWAVEVTRLEDLPRIVRRAAKVAMTPPTGPVFISLPGDILNNEAGIDLASVTRIDTRVRPSDEVIEALADRILKAERPALLCGDEIVKSNALEEAAQLSEVLGCPAFQSTISYGAHFLSERPCFVGALGRDQKQVRDTLSPYDTMIVLGSDVLRMSVWSEIDAKPDHLRLVQIGLVDWEIGKNYPADFAVKADVRETIRALIPVLQEEGRLGARRARREGHRFAFEDELDREARSGRRRREEALVSNADPRRLDDLLPGRSDAEGRHPGQRRHHLGAAGEHPVCLPRPLRHARQCGGRHRLGAAGGDRRADGAAEPAGHLPLRRRLGDVFGAGAVDRGEPEAADHLRHLQQRRLPHHQAAAEGLPRQRPLHRHGLPGPRARLGGARQVDGHERRARHRAEPSSPMC